MEIGRDVATFIIGLVTSAVTGIGIWAARRGSREQVKLAAAAHEYQALKDRASLAEAAEQRERDYASRERARAERAEEELDTVRDEFRKRIVDIEQAHRAEDIARTAKCRAEVKRLEDTVQLLHKVVLNEVAKTAAEQALQEGRSHPHEDDLIDWLNEPEENNG